MIDFLYNHGYSIPHMRRNGKDKKGEVIGCLLSISPRNKKNGMDATSVNRQENNSPVIFSLHDEDRRLIAQRRGNHNRLGFGVQIGTLRFLGTFLADPVNIPVGVIAYVASQLGIANPQCIVRYAERVQTRAAIMRRKFDNTTVTKSFPIVEEGLP